MMASLFRSYLMIQSHAVVKADLCSQNRMGTNYGSYF